MYLTLFAVEIQFAWQSLIRTRPSATVRQKNLKTAFFTPNASCVFCPIHTTQEQNSKIKQSPIILDFSVFDENSVKKITRLLWRHPAVLKSSVFKCFQSTRKRRASIFKFLRFRGGWVWAVGVLNRTNKAALTNFSGVMWTLATPPWNYCWMIYRDFRNTAVNASVSGFRFTRWENEKETKTEKGVCSHWLVRDSSPSVPCRK